MKKIISSLLLVFVLTLPQFANAELTREELIAQIRAQIASLQAQLLALQSGQTGTNSPNPVPNTTCVNLLNEFTLLAHDRNTNGEVTKLQNFLRNRSESVWPQSIPSTGYFGTVTKKALANFQIHHLLISGEFSRSYGVLDRTTRDFIKNLTCDTSTPEVPDLPGPQSISLSVSKNDGVAPLSVTFQATLKNLPSCSGFGWDFGDGTFSQVTPSCASDSTGFIASRVVTTSHTYQTAGTFQASVSSGAVSDLETIRVTSVVTPINTYEIEVTVANQVQCIQAPCPPQPIAEASVSILKNGILVATGTTDNNGFFKAGQIMPGTYVVRASKSGFSETTKTIVVTNADVSTQIILNWTSITPNAPVLSLIQPSFGPIGTTITLYGSGFTSTGNKIKFGNLGSEFNPSYNLSSDGHTLTFNVPSSHYFECFNSNPACAVASAPVTPGTYEVSVMNANGMSNSKTFTITANTVQQPTLSILSPVNSATWQIGSTQTLAWQIQNMPVGAVLIFSLSDGPTPGRLRVLQDVASAGDTSVMIPESVFAGDVGMMLATGNYKIKATLYDKMPCLALCPQSNPSYDARVIAQAQSNAVITIAPKVITPTVNPTLTVSPTSGVAPLTANFVATFQAYSGCVGNVSWNFGDGQVFSIPGCIADYTDGAVPFTKTMAVSHYYTTPGTYTVTVSIGGINFTPVTVSVSGTNTQSVLGDLDFDGNVSLIDLVMLQNHLSGTTLLTGQALLNANLDINETVNLADLTLLRKVILGVINTSDLPLMWGDINVDGVVSVSDTVLSNRLASGLPTEITNKGRVAADVDMNGAFTIADSKLITGNALGTISLPAVYGDMDDDFAVTLVDLLMLRRYVDNVEVPTTRQRFLGDVYNNNQLNEDDLSMLRQFIVGAITTLPVMP